MKTLKDLYSSQGFEDFISDKLGNDLFISDPERAERIHAAAENGADGSTHAEVIEDWREYLGTFQEFDPEFDDECTDSMLPADVRESISAEIDACEAWHEKNGSLYQEIG